MDFDFRNSNLSDPPSPKLNKNESQTDAGYCESFTVPSHLIGLSLGKHSTNLNRIRGLEGITKVIFKNDVFRIYGESEEIVKLARNLLEYADKQVVVSRTLINTLKAKDGELMKHIIFESGLVRIEVDDDSDKPVSKRTEYPSLTLRGTVDSIEDATVRLEQLMKVFSSVTSKKDKKERERKQYKFSESFKVEKKLVGLALGRKGYNIQQAREIKGVGAIDKNDHDNAYTQFTVYGDSVDGVKQARAMIELVEDASLCIDKSKVGLVIGPKGKNINEVKTLSGVKRIDMKNSSKYANDGPMISLVILGNPQQVNLAKQCIKIKLGL